MRTLWQATMLALALFGAGLTVLSLLHVNDNGTFGFTWQGVSSTTLLVTSLDTDGAADKAGIRKGDKLSIKGDPFARIALQTTRPGDRLAVRVNGNSTPLELTAAPAFTSVPLVLLIVLVATRLAFLMMGALIAVRRSDDRAARSLATFLVLFGLAITFGTDLQQFGPIAARFAAIVAVETLYVIAAGAALSFACHFPEPPRDRWRRAIVRATVPLVALALIFSWTRLLVACFGNATQTWLTGILVAFTMTYSVILVLAVAAITASYLRAEGADRVRIRWVLLIFAAGFSGLLVYFAFAPFAGNSELLQLWTLTVVVIPFGLAYVILRHRILDIGFVINRAAVYTIVSLTIVGIFVLSEWLIGHLVERSSKTSLWLNLGLALVLGLSARYIHDWVDRWVDDLFFRQRHLAEAAIRRFAQEAPLITDSGVLIERTVEVAQNNARLTSAAFYTKRDGRYVPLAATSPPASAVDENDAAVLAMRTWHAPVDVPDARSALAGEVAFPMMVRGALAGFLLCGPKISHEIIAPDERSALAMLARDAGIALDSLRTTTIEREIANLAREGALPASVLDRLSPSGGSR